MKPLILDANVLVRFLVQDDPKRTAAANKLMSNAQAGAYELELDPMIVAEVVYVLAAGYKRPRVDVANLLLAIIQSPCVKAEQEAELIDALLRFRDRGVDFADAWLASKAAKTKHEIASFDRDLDKFKDITRFEPKG
jgi:predicted nucleic-acid-binding protein